METGRSSSSSFFGGGGWQSHGSYMVDKNRKMKDQLTAHDIANRILRKENFLVALVNRGLLPLQPIPWLPSVMTKTLEWNLYVTILDAMFDKQFRIRQSFTLDASALQRRFVLVGVVNLLLMPFVGPFALVFLFLKNICFYNFNITRICLSFYNITFLMYVSRYYSQH